MTVEYDRDGWRAEAKRLRRERDGWRAEARRRIAVEPGDEVYVDCTAYGLDGPHWCEVTSLSPGDMAEYPIKAKVPGRGEGQFKGSEVIALRTPEWLADTRVERHRIEGRYRFTDPRPDREDTPPIHAPVHG
jgi:hypothetical protein